MGGGVSAHSGVHIFTESWPVNFKVRKIPNTDFQMSADYYTGADVASGSYHVNQNSSELQSLEDLAFRADSGV